MLEGGRCPSCESNVRVRFTFKRGVTFKLIALYEERGELDARAVRTERVCSNRDCGYREER